MHALLPDRSAFFRYAASYRRIAEELIHEKSSCVFAHYNNASLT